MKIIRLKSIVHESLKTNIQIPYYKNIEHKNINKSNHFSDNINYNKFMNK